ncbi:AAA family ATPase [Acidihalobacter prosperus]|uniref:Kinase n=1 Tax=Acidihalobacter prosperus TaxID=160660 RepID=A0A1A6C0A7_9GAMM|nr:AAA family ATPase [Acidihalobacter prosperus]OBS07993.1 hypothetical protein Thpro_022243 [Acidihalobacter prosperus]
MQAHINPDHYLQTPQGIVWTEARGRQARARAYTDLEYALREAGEGGVLYLVCGIQGGGKTSWIRDNRSRLEDDAIFLDAALPRRRHRQRALDLAMAHRIPAVAVWIDVSLETALQRNQARPEGERVPVEAIRRVFAQLEPPMQVEGFARVDIVSAAVRLPDVESDRGVSGCQPPA